MTAAPGYVWAVDPALSRLSFAFGDLLSDAIVVESLVTYTDSREGERLGLLGRQVRTYARQRADDFPPAVCWVEQASGRFPNPQLSYCVGTVMGALFEALGVPVWSLPSGAWKKRSVGTGNASKAQVAAWVERRLGVNVASQDEADAVAMVYAGRTMVSTGRWEAAV